MKEEFPNMLYATTESWGPQTFFLTEEQAEETAENLSEAFGEECSITDCDIFWFVEQVDEDTALYKSGLDEYYIRRDGGDYERVKP